MFSKILRLMVVSTFLISLTVQTTTAHGVVGLVKKRSDLRIIGSATTTFAVIGAPLTIGLPMGLGLQAGMAGAAAASTVYGIVAVLGILAIPIGVIILDENGGYEFNFEAIDTHHAEMLGLSRAEILEFNDHVSLFNAVLSELRELPQDADYEAAWSYYVDELGWSMEVRSTLAKISAAVTSHK